MLFVLLQLSVMTLWGNSGGITFTSSKFDEAALN